MTLVVSLALFSFFLLVAGLRYRRRRGSIKNLRGPPSPSLLVGHEIEYRHQDQVGDLDFAWVREYGTAFRIGGCYGEDVLMVADPKALQYIFHTSGYHYPKRADALQTTRIIMGRGIVWASGDVHQRHRKVMNPAFAAPQLRSFLPIFQRSASRLTQKWKDQVQTGGQTLNVTRWLARTTLDVIGESAFDYRFGALDNEQNELSKVFENLFADSLLYPPTWDLLFKALWRYVPENILRYVEFLPTREYLRFRKFRALANRIAGQLVDQKTSTIQAEASSRDLMSILVRSNMSEDLKRRLDEDEMLSQMATLMLAGHETTASSLSWLLLELSRHPDDQKKIRDEIAAIRAKAHGKRDLTIADFDGMVFTNAALKESLRLHPIVPALVREAGRDDLIPLSSPITTKSGDTLSEIPINKGQSISISICAYNRLPAVWGEDAEQWNPSRFLEASKDKQTSVGVYANLMTFAAGIRGCIGWRFALIEMQAILVELIENFEFSLPEGGIDIQRIPAGLMIPMVRGKMHEGTQLPLCVSLVDD